MALNIKDPLGSAPLILGSTNHEPLLFIVVLHFVALS